MSSTEGGRRVRRVVQVTPFYPPHVGGVEECAREIALELGRRDIECTIITSRTGAAPMFESEALNVSVRRSRAVSVLNTPLAPGCLLDLVRARRPDIVHVHATQALYPEVARTYCAALKVPLLFHYHMDVPATEHRGLFERYKSQILSSTARSADVVVSLTEEQKYFLVKHWQVAPERVRVVANGVRDEFFAIYGQRKPLAGSRLLCVARLSVQKRIDRLLQACAVLHEPWQLTVCGDGPDRSELGKMARDLGIEHRVLFRGAVDRSEMLEMYATHDVFVLPSDVEGMSLALLEGMAAGMPVVATNVSGNASTVGPGGVLVEPTVDGLADGISAVLSNLRLRSELASSGNSRAQLHRWGRTVDGLMDAYLQALSMRQRIR